jgi:acetylornithine deacetylase/succinyl-diaminopimelate desuccinylase-like protein
VVELLRELIRVDTSNPPGNESAAAELLRAYLEDAGVECGLFTKVAGRANLVARIRGSGERPSLALLSHTDVVPADAREWSVDPFGGELRDGFVWGRGALDMKGQVAASAVAVATLAREGWRPRGDLVFVAAADEEVGGDIGLQWLVREHSEACRTDYSINEGAGDRLELAGRTLYLCATAEKMTAPFRLRVHGRSGHASMPAIADNALVKAARLVERLGTWTPEPELGPETSAFLAAIHDGEQPPANEALALARSIDPVAGALLEPLLGTTVSPTMVTASQKRNVIPALCDVSVDCRLLPGHRPEEALAAVRALLGEGDYELETMQEQGGTRSPASGPLWDAVQSFVDVEEPGARAAPICTPGFTDSHWLREAFGTVAYGFFPARFDPETAARLIHSADERVPVDDLGLGLRFLRHVAQAICGE